MKQLIHLCECLTCECSENQRQYAEGVRLLHIKNGKLTCLTEEPIDECRRNMSKIGIMSVAQFDEKEIL